MSIQVSAQALVAIISVLVVICAVLVVIMAARRPRSLSSQLGQIERATQSLEQLTRVFSVPHTRGGVGETLLTDLLTNWLPDRAFDTQYRFRTGTIADAVIRVGDRLVAVDSKFPLEQIGELLNDGPTDELPSSVRRLFLRHARDIASKYIRIDEGTLDFALMYVPSESLYYRLFVSGDGSLNREVLEQSVVPVGPNGLFLYLQTVSFGRRGAALDTNRLEVIETITQLSRSFAGVKKPVDTAIGHLRNALKATEEAHTRIREYELLLRKLEELR